MRYFSEPRDPEFFSINPGYSFSTVPAHFCHWKFLSCSDGFLFTLLCLRNLEWEKIVESRIPVCFSFWVSLHFCVLYQKYFIPSIWTENCWKELLLSGNWPLVTMKLKFYVAISDRNYEFVGEEFVGIPLFFQMFRVEMVKTQSKSDAVQQLQCKIEILVELNNNWTLCQLSSMSTELYVPPKTLEPRELQKSLEICTYLYCQTRFWWSSAHSKKMSEKNLNRITALEWKINGVVLSTPGHTRRDKF